MSQSCYHEKAFTFIPEPSRYHMGHPTGFLSSPCVDVQPSYLWPHRLSHMALFRGITCNSGLDALGISQVP